MRVPVSRAFPPDRERLGYRPVAAAFALFGLIVLGGVATASEVPGGWSEQWPRTDFGRARVPLADIRDGGPPRDGIPPLDAPRFVAAAEAARWLDPAEPVLVVEHGGEARAYPFQILIWHEIVNDSVAGLPVAVTFCPLCNSGLVFDRRLDGLMLDFGTTGKLRHSDLVMWDRQTESWWQQMTGEAIVGELAGRTLRMVPAPVMAFRTFRAAYPHGQVLSRETGFERDYGANPYVAYDSNPNPFLFGATPDARLPAVERVVGVALGRQARAYPYRELARAGMANDRLAGQPLVVLFERDTRSALDAGAIARSRAVGNGAVYDARLDGRVLTFEAVGEGWRDRETGSRWNLLGQALDGPLRGRRLRPLPHTNPFAFAWFAFHPASDLWRPPAKQSP